MVSIEIPSDEAASDTETRFCILSPGLLTIAYAMVMEKIRWIKYDLFLESLQTDDEHNSAIANEMRYPIRSTKIMLPSYEGTWLTE